MRIPQTNNQQPFIQTFQATKNLVGGIAQQVAMQSFAEIVAFNTLLRAVDGFMAYKYGFSGFLLGRFVAPLTYSIIDYSTRDALVHEGGHSFIAWLCFKNSFPQIRIDPFKDAYTNFRPLRNLTEIGS